jgi:hypothetical protein
LQERCGETTSERFARHSGYDINTVEFAIKDACRMRSTFMNPAPDAEFASVGEFYHNWIVNAVIDLVFKRLGEGSERPRYRWDALLNPEPVQAYAWRQRLSSRRGRLHRTSPRRPRQTEESSNGYRIDQFSDGFERVEEHLRAEQRQQPDNQRGRGKRPTETSRNRIDKTTNKRKQHTRIRHSQRQSTNASDALQPVNPPQFRSQIIVIIIQLHVVLAFAASVTRQRLLELTRAAS